MVRRRHTGSNINNAHTYQKKLDNEWLAYILQPASELVVSETMYALDRDDDKWTLHDLAAHPDAENADGNCEGLELAHILALRLYTPGAFSSIINPLRVGCSRAKPYPFPTLMVSLSDGAKVSSSAPRLEVSSSCAGSDPATLGAKLRVMAWRPRAEEIHSPLSALVLPHNGWNIVSTLTHERQISGFAGSCDHGTYFGKPELAAGGNCSEVG